MTVLTFGESLLRLSPPEHQRFVQADRFDAEFGGSEANVAVALSRYGMDSRFVTKLPENPLGQAAINYLRRYGVDTEAIVRGGLGWGNTFWRLERRSVGRWSSTTGQMQLSLP